MASDIQVRCRTNIDEYKTVDWPTLLPAVPCVGQWVAGTRGSTHPRLRIVAVCWLPNGTLEVELHRD